MSGLQEILLLNALGATAVALAVALIARFIKRPAVLNVLWMLVLVKLLTPPVFEVEVIPQAAGLLEAADLLAANEPTLAATPLADFVSSLDEATVPLETNVTVDTSARSLMFYPFLVWALGSLLYLSIVALRGLRFARALRTAWLAPDELQIAAARIAAHLGITRAPRLLLIDGNIPPLLWSPFISQSTGAAGPTDRAARSRRGRGVGGPRAGAPPSSRPAGAIPRGRGDGALLVAPGGLVGTPRASRERRAGVRRAGGDHLARTTTGLR